MVADKQEKADPPSDAQLRREVQAMVAAHQELGERFGTELADSFVERLHATIDQRVEARSFKKRKRQRISLSPAGAVTNCRSASHGYRRRRNGWFCLPICHLVSLDRHHRAQHHLGRRQTRLGLTLPDSSASLALRQGDQNSGNSFAQTDSQSSPRLAISRKHDNANSISPGEREVEHEQ